MKSSKKQGCEVPTEFKAFDERFRSTAQILTQQTLEGIGKAMLGSLQRFEKHPDYCDAISHFKSMVAHEQFTTMDEAMPLLDVWEPSKLGEEVIIPAVLERIEDEVEAIENLSYPYDGSKPCFWNLALIIRIQVQLLKTYRDRLSRLVAAAESEFESFFCNEVLRAEILPLVRSALNNPDFLGSVALAESGSTWESVGQVVRIAVENVKSQDGVPGAASVPIPMPKVVSFDDDDADLTLSEDNEEESFVTPESEPEPYSEPEPLPEPTPVAMRTTPKPAPARRPVEGLQAKDVPRPATYTEPEENEDSEDFEEW